MMASTLFFWLRLSSVHEKYKTAMTVTGLVTFIAAYHYIRIFNSWVDAYEFPAVTEGAAEVPFLYVVYTLLVGLKEAIASEGNPKVASMLTQVCYATVISWCTYPVVYLFPLLGFNDAKAVIAIQLGYCVSDIISKCGVGFLIYNITITKSAALNNSLLGK